MWHALTEGRRADVVETRVTVDVEPIELTLGREGHGPVLALSYRPGSRRLPRTLRDRTRRGVGWLNLYEEGSSLIRRLLSGDLPAEVEMLSLHVTHDPGVTTERIWKAGLRLAGTIPEGVLGRFLDDAEVAGLGSLVAQEQGRGAFLHSRAESGPWLELLGITGEGTALQAIAVLDRDRHPVDPDDVPEPAEGLADTVRSLRGLSVLTRLGPEDGSAAPRHLLLHADAMWLAGVMSVSRRGERIAWAYQEQVLVTPTPGAPRFPMEAPEILPTLNVTVTTTEASTTHEVTVGSYVLGAFLTPFTLVADAATFVVWIWLDDVTGHDDDDDVY